MDKTTPACQVFTVLPFSAEVGVGLSLDWHTTIQTFVVLAYTNIFKQLAITRLSRSVNDIMLKLNLKTKISHVTSKYLIIVCRSI